MTVSYKHAPRGTAEHCANIPLLESLRMSGVGVVKRIQTHITARWRRFPDLCEIHRGPCIKSLLVTPSSESMAWSQSPIPTAMDFSAWNKLFLHRVIITLLSSCVVSVYAFTGGRQIALVGKPTTQLMGVVVLQLPTQCERREYTKVFTVQPVLEIVRRLGYQCMEAAVIPRRALSRE